MYNLIPDFLIDSFHNRIEKLIKQGIEKNHLSIERELNRIRLINGNVLPEKIKLLIV